jgi:hypothetical protein
VLGDHVGRVDYLLAMLVLPLLVRPRVEPVRRNVLQRRNDLI